MKKTATESAKRAAEYREKASDCLGRAARATNREERAGLLAIAQDWHRLAWIVSKAGMPFEPIKWQRRLRA